MTLEATWKIKATAQEQEIASLKDEVKRLAGEYRRVRRQRDKARATALDEAAAKVASKKIGTTGSPEVDYWTRGFDFGIDKAVNEIAALKETTP